MSDRAILTRVGGHTEQVTDYTKNTWKLKGRFRIVPVVDLFA